jgi:hypothetical protein
MPLASGIDRFASSRVSQATCFASSVEWEWPPTTLHRKVSPDFDAGLFEHFPGHAVGWGLVEIQDAARWDPAAVVVALDGKNAAVVAEYDSGHAD